MSNQMNNQTNNPSFEQSNVKSFFIYLLMIFALYVTVGCTISLLFQYVDILFPKNYDYYVSSKGFAMFIRCNIAILFVSYFAFLYTFQLTQKEMRINPLKENMLIRKIGIYFTLFIVAIVLLVDLSIVIYCFLNGDITQRFLLKVLIILFLFSWIFHFFLRASKRGWSSKQLKIFGIVNTIIILLVLGYGVILTGSPFKARQQSLDERRIQNLSYIQSKIMYYWQRNQVLPTSLSAMNNTLTGEHIPVDPKTRKPYEYKVISPLSFQLCGNFELSSETNTRYYNDYDFNWNWKHPAGNYCFTRTIDKKLIKPIPVKN